MRAVAYLLVLATCAVLCHVAQVKAEILETRAEKKSCASSVSLDSILELVDSYLKLVSGQGKVSEVIKAWYDLLGIQVDGTTTQELLGNIPLLGRVLKLILNLQNGFLKNVPLIGPVVANTLGVSARSHMVPSEYGQYQV